MDRQNLPREVEDSIEAAKRDRDEAILAMSERELFQQFITKEREAGAIIFAACIAHSSGVTPYRIMDDAFALLREFRRRTA